MKREYVYFTLMGSVWRFTPRNAERLLRRAAAGNSWDIRKYATEVCVLEATDLTDLDAEEAHWLLVDYDRTESHFKVQP